jgi:integrase
LKPVLSKKSTHNLEILHPGIRQTPLDAAFARYRADLIALQRSPATLAFYSCLDRFAWWVAHTARPPDPAQLSANDLQAFFVYARDTTPRWGSSRPNAARPLSVSALKSYWRALRAFFAWLVLEGSLPSSPFAGPVLRRFYTTTLARAPVPAVAPFSEAEVARLLGACHPTGARGVRNEAIIRVLVRTGMRASELCGLRRSDYDRETGRLHVTGAKRSGTRTLPLSLPARQALHRWLDNH